MDAFVGFYWTLPVNWAGFRDLPRDPEAAAAKSATIRYQMERVRRHVREVGGTLAGEIVFMDTRPDRATAAVQEGLARARTLCADRDATLLFVEFADSHFWRRNPHLHDALRDYGMRPEGLSPVPLTIDGRFFDPARHFGDWRRRDATAAARLRRDARAGLEDALARTPEGPGRTKAMADLLNATGVATVRGGAWTAENVRKALGRTGLAKLATPTPNR